MVSEPDHVLIITKNFEDNSTGRAKVLWELSKKCGKSATVLSSVGKSIWRPLKGSSFEKDCFLLERGFCNQLVGPDSKRSVREFLTDSTLIVAVKPQRLSYGLARRFRKRYGTPILLDIDDPDLEYQLRLGNRREALTRALFRPREYWPAKKIRRDLSRETIIVSNPVLQRTYGGRIVPHARPDLGVGAPHVTRNPRVVFIGTSRPHKGLNLLRQAIADLHNEGFTLLVTADPPEDRRPWEMWVGPKTISASNEILKQADIVALPSDPQSCLAAGQLPAKLIDAMVTGRGIVVSNIEPMTWALKDAGLVMSEYTVNSLRQCLMSLRAPEIRTELGQLARANALLMFDTNSVSPTFYRACKDAFMSNS